MRNIYKLSFLLLIIITIFLLSCNNNNNIEIYSPNNKLKAELYFKNSSFFYKINYKNDDILEESKLGLMLDSDDFTENIELVSKSQKIINERYHMPCGIKKQYLNHCTETEFVLKNKKSNNIFKIIFRLFDDGYAFRYLIPEGNAFTNFEIKDECSEFNFKNDNYCWSIPADIFAYEGIYTKKKISELNHINTPVTIKNNNLYLSVHEAALYDYSEMTLIKDKEANLKLKSFLWTDGNGKKVIARTPFQTPWRYMIIAEDLNGLVNSSICTNLNENCKIEDTNWIKPMKFLGVWWALHTKKQSWYYGKNHGANNENVKKCIDFASENGINGVIAEGWNKGWESWNGKDTCIQDYCVSYPDFNLDDIVSYAKSKNVDFITHFETGGNISLFEKQLDSAFMLCEKLKINAAKTGYAGTILPLGYHHHGQKMVIHFNNVVKQAAKYKIMLNVHESIKPTGIERTYPNLMTQEAGRGIEWCATYRTNPPSHTVTLPFTRMLAGPFDYTPGIFKINHSPEKKLKLNSTLANQLALYVLLYSPMHMLADEIDNYKNISAFDFLKKVPVCWDETRVIDAEIGEYAIFARKKDNVWYIGGQTNENEKSISIKLDFLQNNEYYAEIYYDSDSTDWLNYPEKIEIGQYKISSSDSIIITIAKCGGFAAIISPEKNNFSPIAVFNENSIKRYSIFKNNTSYWPIDVINKAKGKKLSINNYTEDNKYLNPEILNDGKKHNFDYNSQNWCGFNGQNMNVTFDMEEINDFNSIKLSFLEIINDWIFLPSKVVAYSSNDNINYKLIAEETLPYALPTNDYNIKDIHFNKAFKARYIKIIATNIGKCPEWHHGKGMNSWIFCDEIEIN